MAALLAHLSGPGTSCLLIDLICYDRDVSALLIQDHSQLSVELLYFQVDPILALKDLTDLPLVHTFIQVLNWRRQNLTK